MLSFFIKHFKPLTSFHLAPVRLFTIDDRHIKYMRDSMTKAGMVRKQLSPQVFDSVSKEMYNRLYTACKKLCADYSHRGSCVEDTQNKRIQISIKNRGMLELWVDRDRQVMYFFSPISGTHRYWYESINEVWLSEIDWHNMLERVCRELMAIGPIRM